MTNVFKIHTGGVPEYLLNIFPKKHEQESSYNTRKKNILFLDAYYNYLETHLYLML